MQDEIQQAITTLNQGGIILYPTDTIWGIGCDATNSQAVKKIIDLKNREATKSMIILVNSDMMLYRYFKEIPDLAFQLWELATRPTTLVLDNPKNIAPELIAPDNSVGVRWVRDSFCYRLIERLKKPIVSTSANLSGQPYPLHFKEISPEIIQGVDYVVNGPLEHPNSKPSSIIKLQLNGEVKIIRE
jgi:L-threonylcarbamoyladenylate synthase